MAAEACCNGKGGANHMKSLNFLELAKEKKHKCDVKDTATEKTESDEEEIGD